MKGFLSKTGKNLSKAFGRVASFVPQSVALAGVGAALISLGIAGLLGPAAGEIAGGVFLILAAIDSRS